MLALAEMPTRLKIGGMAILLLIVVGANSSERELVILLGVGSMAA